MNVKKSVACGEKTQPKHPLKCFVLLAQSHFWQPWRAAPDAADRPELTVSDQTLPTVFSRARGWISACDSTVVWARKRSTSERTKGRIEAEVTNTGASPSRAARSKESRTAAMNSDSFDGCIARLRSSPVPTMDSAKACSHLADSAISGR